MRKEAARRRFSREFKAEAVRQVVGEGRKRREASKEQGINKTLLERCMKQLRNTNAVAPLVAPSRWPMRAKDTSRGYTDQRMVRIRPCPQEAVDMREHSVGSLSVNRPGFPGDPVT